MKILAFKVQYLVLAILLTLSGSLHARADGFGFEYEISEAEKLSEAQILAVNELLNTAQKILPSAIRSVIARKIKIKFIDMGTKTLKLPVCFNGEAQEEQDHDESKQTLAYVRDFGLFRADTIRVNKALLEDIVAGERNSREYGCGHRSMYNLALATILHETGHIYDFTAKISSRDRFLKLMNFQKRKGRYQSKNILASRSPDPYEFKNPRESFAVNLEYFLLDPEFQCRKPAVNQLYSEMLSHTAFRSFACAVNTEVFLNMADPKDDLKHPVNIDPARVYQIHYFFASKGKALMSRWGHAMYRIVLCAPSRKEVGPECMQDVAWHVIISYRANVGDMVVNYLKGLFGGYPSQLFMLPLAEVVPEYTKNELRDVLSLPIELTSEERTRFIHATLEHYWSYLGKYRFLTNNCGTESVHLMKGIFNDAKIQNKLKATTPRKLYKTFEKVGLADDEKLSDRESAEMAGLWFRSKQVDLERSFALVHPYLPKYKDMDHFFEESTVEERKKAFEGAGLSGQDRSRLAASFYVLENQILFQTEKALEKKFMKYLEKEHGKEKDAAPSELSDVMAGLNAMYKPRYPWAKLTGGYGVPQFYDFAETELEAPQADPEKDKLTNEKLVSWAKQQFPAEVSSLEAVISARVYFRAEIVKK